MSVSKTVSIPKPKSGGPKTAAGRKKASLNSTTHGLTGTRVLPDEMQMVTDFTQELIDYYKPKSPLEVLQIQRTAFCRAKLAKLLDIEIAGRELARRQLDRQPHVIMDQLQQYPLQARNIALKLITGQPFLEKLHLSEEKLKDIAIEIQNFAGTIDSPEMLQLALPKLCGYLLSVQFVPNEAQGLVPDSKLMLLAARINMIFEEQDPLDTDNSEISKILRTIARENSLENMANRQRALRQGPAGYHKTIEPDLQAVLSLWNMHQIAKHAIDSYHELKSWSVRALDLSMDNAERLI